jgi:uncharacterized protein (DUF1778 family)
MSTYNKPHLNLAQQLDLLASRGMEIEDRSQVSAEQGAVIRQAAEVEGSTVTDFTVRATLAHAKDVLADRRTFALDDAAWTEFLAILDRPTQHKPRLARLIAEDSIFE